MAAAGLAPSGPEQQARTETAGLSDAEHQALVEDTPVQEAPRDRLAWFFALDPAMFVMANGRLPRHEETGEQRAKGGGAGGSGVAEARDADADEDERRTRQRLE
jgi:hypothetical protein